LLLGLIDHRLVGAKDRINFCVEFLAHARPHFPCSMGTPKRSILLAGPGAAQADALLEVRERRRSRWWQCARPRPRGVPKNRH
jgi:hypothetical protein